MKPLALEVELCVNRFNDRTDNVDEIDVTVVASYYPEDDDIEIEDVFETNSSRAFELSDQDGERAIERLWGQVCDLDEEEDEGEIEAYDRMKDASLLEDFE